MADFTPIETQEELDRIIGERLKREREAAAKKYADYDDLKASVASLTEERDAAKKTAAETVEKYKDYDKNIEDLKSKVHGYETDLVKTKVALAVGLPYEMASRLRGETEEDLRKDAEALKGFYNPVQHQPLADPEPDAKNPKKEALKTMLSNLTKEG